MQTLSTHISKMPNLLGATWDSLDCLDIPWCSLKPLWMTWQRLRKMTKHFQVISRDLKQSFDFTDAVGNLHFTSTLSQDSQSLIDSWPACLLIGGVVTSLNPSPDHWKSAWKLCEVSLYKCLFQTLHQPKDSKQNGQDCEGIHLEAHYLKLHTFQIKISYKIW